MKNLHNYIEEQESVNEGLIMNSLTLKKLKNIDPDHFLEGLLNMYDYIVDEDNMDLFYQDYPMSERLLWKNLYELYQKKVWSIVDVNLRNPNTKKWLEESFPSHNELIKVTVDFRRNLRKFIKESRNNKLEIKASEPESMLTVLDNVNNKIYIITINRTTGALRRIFRAIDKKYLEFAFSRLAKNSPEIDLSDESMEEDF